MLEFLPYLQKRENTDKSILFNFGIFKGLMDLFTL